jgi:carbohydrate-binding DOMON domain-containing protein
MVSGETTWSDYKGMFGWNGTLYIEEKKNHCDNWLLTNNTMEWFAPRGAPNSGMIKQYVSITITNTQTVTTTLTETETETSISNNTIVSTVVTTQQITATTNVVATATQTVTTTKSDSDGFGMIIGISSILSMALVLGLKRRK